MKIRRGLWERGGTGHDISLKKVCTGATKACPIAFDKAAALVKRRVLNAGDPLGDADVGGTVALAAPRALDHTVLPHGRVRQEHGRHRREGSQRHQEPRTPEKPRGR